MLPKAWSWVVLLLTSSWLSIATAENAQPKEKTGKPITVTTQSTVEGEEQVWGIGTENRRLIRYPSLYGSVGTFRVRSAESLPTGSLSFGIGGEFYTTTDGPDLGTGGSRSAKTIAETIFVGFSPFDNFTFSITRRNSSTTFGNPQKLISSLGDFGFAGQYTFLTNDVLALGAMADLQVASQFNALDPDGSTISAGAGALLTWCWYRMLGVPIFFHFNFIYHSPQMRNSVAAGLRPETFFQFSRFSTLTSAFGIEWVMGDFIPFFEFMQVNHLNSGISFGSMPSKITVGSRFTPISNKSLALLLGVDVGLGRGLTPGVPFSPPWQIVAQASYTVGLFETERKHYYTQPDVGVVDRKFVIKKNINFKIASAELEGNSSQLLDQIAKVVIDNKIRKLLIVGHTDSSHGEDYNMTLSMNRARTVKNYLVSKGISEETFMTQGYGKRRPKAPNSTEEGRSLNRRVEFLIVE